MLQKRNDMEIVDLLRQQPTHLRQIATQLDLIPSTAMRILHKLQKEAVVDFQQEGRNNKYFLKETPEAKTYLFITEHYKLLKLLENPTMRMLIKELKTATQGELIVLFGSFAKNMQTKHSDVDLYIETPNQQLKQKLQNLSEKLSIKIGTFDKSSALGQEIIKNHVILRNVERFYQITT